jgi:kynurenine formamidase
MSPKDKLRIIDLSLPLSESIVEPEPPKIKRINHKRGAVLLGLSVYLAKGRSLASLLKALFSYIVGIRKLKQKDFPEQMGLAWEKVKLSTHSGTHLDAPWHYGATSEGKPAPTIDEIPLENFYGDGVRLDLRHKKPGEFITVEDLTDALAEINYKIKPGDIVLLMTGTSKHWNVNDYQIAHPGMSREATLWLLERGVKVIGTDGYGFDRPFKSMVEYYRHTKDNSFLWPGHLTGRTKEYYHIEKMANLEQIPKPHGFKVACFPIKVEKGSAGWVRPVAIVEASKHKKD